MKYTFVQTNTSDDLILSGLFSENNYKKKVVLHIHGYEGDFYTNKFIHSIAESLDTNDYSFLTVQHRGTGAESEIYHYPYGSGGIKLGSHYEKLEDAHIDISAWIKFLKSLGYQEIILQGHSLGTLKVVRYMYEGEYRDQIEKVILLAPFDKNFEIKSAFEKTEFFKNGKSLQEMIWVVKQEIERGNGRNIAPFVIDNDMRSYENLYSWAQNDEFGEMFNFSEFITYDFPILSKLNRETCIIVGSVDPFFHPSNPSNPKEVLELLSQKNKFISPNLIEGADHGFEGYEDQISNTILEFLKN